jgi:hypothetical protein
MNFQEATEKKQFYLNETELFTSHNRLKLWENCKEELLHLLKELYFLYEVKAFYFVNDFINKNILLMDEAHVMFELNKENFEDLVDSHLLEQYGKGVKYYCKVGDEVYLLENSNWRKYEEKIYSIIME